MGFVLFSPFVGFVSSGLLRSWNHELELIATSLDAAGGP
jgi:hypothetical protein